MSSVTINLEAKVTFNILSKFK